MDNKNLQKELQSIHQKLDMITARMDEDQKKRREFDELKDDLAIIGKDIFNTAVHELEDVAPYFDTDDLIHLVKKLLRNTRNLTRMLDQLESLQDLYTDVQPLGKEIFGELLENLSEMDSKGYFEFLKESMQIVDTIVTSFTLEDVRLLRENITSILLTVKSMTQPEMLSSMNNALDFFKKMDIEVDKDVSLFSIIKQMRDPEVKRGMLFMLEFVKNMAEPKKINLQNN